MRTAFSMVLAAAYASIALEVASAAAAVYFVDGACTTSGNGTSLDCGPSGAFRTVGEGIVAIQPGDTLNVRGAHDGFDGIYFEALAIRNGAAQSGKALACTADRPCVIQGCRAPACRTDEQPIVRGMRLRADWTDQGRGVYSRAMEEGPSPLSNPPARDAFDPTMLVQGPTAPFTMLAYAGDGVDAPADGAWSYHPATNRIVVNPVGKADPAATIFVPHFGWNVHIQSPSAHVTLRYLTFEGSRQKSIEIETLPPKAVEGVLLSHLVLRFVPQHFVHTSRRAPGFVIEDSLAEYGGRGISWAQPSSDGVFGYRLFGIHGGAIRRNVVRHLGATGRRRLSCGPACTNAWPCPWCDPPWNDARHTDISTSGVAYQVKQTDTVTIEDNVAEDVSTDAIDLDVSRHATVQRNRVRRAAAAIEMRNFTPTSGCPTAATAQFCYNSDHVIQDNVLDEVGFANARHCGIAIVAGSERHEGTKMLAHVYNNFISRPAFAGICLDNGGETKGGSVTPISDVSIWHNTIYGVRLVAGGSPSRGIVVGGATRNVSIRNNVFDALTAEALVIGTTAAPGLSLDGDVIGTTGPCPVRWNVPPFTLTPSGGSCDPLAAHEAHGRMGRLRFADVTTVPPDLHLTAGSVAIDAGVPSGVATDIDGDRRPQGAGPDTGADEWRDGAATVLRPSSRAPSRSRTRMPAN